MESTDKQDSSIRSEGIGLLKILYKKRLLILLFSGLSIVSSILFSSPFFIKPQYKSVVILYPPATNSNKILLERYAEFGVDKDIDDEMQILESSIVRDSVIRKYNLVKKYGLTPDTYYKVEKRYDDNVQIERTRFNSIAITVFDNDPVIAARIANDIVKISDEVKSDILSHNLNAALHCIALDYMKKLSELDYAGVEVPKGIMNTSLPDTGIDPRTIAGEMKRQIALMRGKKEKGSGLPSDYNAFLASLNAIQNEYEEAASNLNSRFPTAYVISPAEVSNKKAYPVRSLIVLITALGSFFIITIWVIGMDKFNRFRALLKK